LLVARGESQTLDNGRVQEVLRMMLNSLDTWINHTYQTSELFHPLTCVCGAGNLEARMGDEGTELYCHKCDYIQDVPEHLVDLWRKDVEEGIFSKLKRSH
jgi:hypothetical protein